MMSANKLANFINDKMTAAVKGVMLTRDNTGKYYFFGKYIVINSKNIYKVYCLENDSVIDFYNLKNATAWCVFDNTGNYSDARRIHYLDLKLSSIDLDIAIHKNKLKALKNASTSLIYITKLQEDVYKRKLVLLELSNHINKSRKIQDNNFNAKAYKIKRIR